MGSFRKPNAPASERSDCTSLFYAAAASGNINEAFVAELLRRFDSDEDREAIVALYGKFCLDRERLLKFALTQATTVKITHDNTISEV